MLTARAGGAEGVDAEVFRVQRKVHLFRLRHHGHCGRGGMDAALRLRFRHPLHPVDAALVLEAVVCPCAVHREDGFLHAAKLRLVEVEHFQLPPTALHIHRVHPHQAVGKQGSFLAACPAADLHDDAFAIVHILGQEQDFERIFQFFHILTFFADLLLYHFLKVRVEGLPFEQGFCLSEMILRRCQGLIGLHHWLGLMVFLHQAAKQRIR